MHRPVRLRSLRILRRIALSALAAFLLAPAAYGGPKPRLETGPGTSHGSLSVRFPEVEVKVSSSFAHDRGMMSHIDKLSVAGTACAPNEVLQKLVAHRKGWTRSGGSSDSDVVATMQAFVDDWASLFHYSGRMTSKTAPGPLSKRLKPGDPAYHPPRVAIYPLDDKDKIVVHAYFDTHDGGNHGRQYSYNVEAFRVSTGASFSLYQDGRSPALVPKAGDPQPVNANIPRPRSIGR